MGKRKVIKTLEENGWYVESGIDLSQLTEKQLYGIISELNAYAELEDVPIDFGSGLIDTSHLTKDLRMGGTESFYLELGMASVWGYLGYGYYECEWFDNLDRCDFNCECYRCNVDMSYALFVYEDIKYKNRHRNFPSYKKYRDLLKGYNIRKNQFLKKSFIFTDIEFENEVNENLSSSNGCLEDSYSASELVGKGYYKIYDNRIRTKVLKKNSRKKVRTYLKELKNDLSNCDYKKVYDFDFNFD